MKKLLTIIAVFATFIGCKNGHISPQRPFGIDHIPPCPCDTNHEYWVSVSVSDVAFVADTCIPKKIYSIWSKEVVDLMQSFQCVSRYDYHRFDVNGVFHNEKTFLEIMYEQAVGKGWPASSIKM